MDEELIKAIKHLFQEHAWLILRCLEILISLKGIIAFLVSLNADPCLLE
jgi:hypothetical protein